MRRVIMPLALAEAASVAGMSPAIRAGDVLYLTGATGADLDGMMPLDVGQQTRNALAKISEILAHVDADLDHVVEVTSYHVTIRETFSPVEDVLRSSFAHPLPAWTAIGVSELRRPGALVEFRTVAYLGDTGSLI